MEGSKEKNLDSPELNSDDDITDFEEEVGGLSTFPEGEMKEETQGRTEVSKLVAVSLNILL